MKIATTRHINANGESPIYIYQKDDEVWIAWRHDGEKKPGATHAAKMTTWEVGALEEVRYTSEAGKKIIARVGPEYHEIARAPRLLKQLLANLA